MTLRDYLETHKIRAATFARLIGVSEATVSRYLSGERKPDWDTVMPRIKEVTNGQVTADSFLSKRSVEKRRPCAA